jgi:hypothetical protein
VSTIVFWFNHSIFLRRVSDKGSQPGFRAHLKVVMQPSWSFIRISFVEEYG